MNKTDLAPYVGADLGVMAADALVGRAALARTVSEAGGPLGWMGA